MWFEYLFHEEIDNIVRLLSLIHKNVNEFVILHFYAHPALVSGTIEAIVHENY